MAKNTKRRTWRKLTRKDISNFDDYGTKAVLFAMDHGGVGLISGRGHAMLKAPDGRIMGVAQNTDKARSVIANDLRALFGEGFDDRGNGRAVERPAAGSLAREVLEPDPVTQLEPTLECYEPSCEAVFVTEGARYSHIHKQHHVCPEPGCNFTRAKQPAVVSHHRLAHLGIRPRAGTGGKRAVPGHALVGITVTETDDPLRPVAEFRCECGKTGTRTLGYDGRDAEDAARLVRNAAAESFRGHRRHAAGRPVPVAATETQQEANHPAEVAPARERATSRARAPKAAPAPRADDLLEELVATVRRIDEQTAATGRLEERVAELEAENRALRDQLAAVRAALAGD